MPKPDEPVEMLCRYRLKPGKEREFVALLARHWPTLHAAGLATAAPARVLRGEDKAGNVAFFESFAWKTGKSAAAAHESPKSCASGSPWARSAKTWSSGMSKRCRSSKQAPDSAAGAGDAGAAVGRANTIPAPAGGPVASDVLDAVFSALAHPARRRILLVLHARGGAMGAGEIADRFKHAWPTTTRHLGVLESAGVLDVVKQGRQRLYTLRPRLLVDAARWLHGWASLSPEDAGTVDRPDWAGLPYATMRNTTSPGHPPRRSAIERESGR